MTPALKHAPVDAIKRSQAEADLSAEQLCEQWKWQAHSAAKSSKAEPSAHTDMAAFVHMIPCQWTRPHAAASIRIVHADSLEMETYLFHKRWPVTGCKHLGPPHECKVVLDECVWAAITCINQSIHTPLNPTIHHANANKVGLLGHPSAWQAEQGAETETVNT